MKRVLFFSLAFYLILISAAPLPAEEQNVGGDKTVYVEVKESRIRAEPRHWAKTLKEVHFGDALTETGREKGWVVVKLENGRQGYIHESAVTTKKVLLKGKGAVTGSSADDVVLAGKGFNKEIESNLAEKDPTLHYKDVDKVEKTKISADELKKFRDEGKLNK
ncbi:MAG: hypothetical protein D6719_07665 [Candidatus Dadabacteria bacterium]|nr:MAG: hypothetical protein D6719_07665 [Candidatus Dadabacteria bacterium]